MKKFYKKPVDLAEEPTIVSQQSPKLPQPSKPRKWLKISLAILLLIILITAPPVIYSYWFLSSFSQAAQTPISQLINTFKSNLNSELPQDQINTNILILGLDEITNQKEGSLLTDTIIVASYNQQSKTLNLFSLPRDLWIDAFKTKINAIYYYGEISQDTTGKEFISSVVSQIIGQPIHHTIVIKLDSLEHIINSVGGVDIEVPESFTDERFPRSDIIPETATNEAQLYETITFEKGIQHMDGQTALKYIRTRQSANLNEGTDIARGKRQQQLIKSLITQISDRQTFTNPNRLGSLYHILRQEIDASEISDTDLIKLAKANGGRFPTIHSLNLPIQDDQIDGLIYNPPITKHNQWVYEPLDLTWSDINQYFIDQLK